MMVFHSMGVKGLWKLLSGTETEIRLEQLSGKILAVDVSVWLNQILKAMRDRDGNRIDNAHIISLFHRLSKLLFHRIRPVFVFDGATPLIKLKTTSLRRKVRDDAARRAFQQNKERINLRLRKLALAQLQGKEVKPGTMQKPDDTKDMFYLEDIQDYKDHLKPIIEMPQPRAKLHYEHQIETINPHSEEFKKLPAKVQYELLLDYIDYVKYSAKAKNHPADTLANSFSDSQIQAVVVKNDLSERIRTLREELNQQQSGSQGIQNAHSVHTYKTIDSEIVFTKKINRESYDIINTRQAPKHTPNCASSEGGSRTTSEVALKSRDGEATRDLKDVFFGSSESEDDGSVTGSDGEGDGGVVRNVFGLKQGHPGSFLNPYKVHTNSIPSHSTPLLRAPLHTESEFLNVSDSSESDDMELADKPTGTTKSSPKDDNDIDEGAGITNANIPADDVNAVEVRETMMTSVSSVDEMVSSVIHEDKKDRPMEGTTLSSSEICIPKAAEITEIKVEHIGDKTSGDGTKEETFQEDGDDRSLPDDGDDKDFVKEFVEMQEKEMKEFEASQEKKVEDSQEKQKFLTPEQPPDLGNLEKETDEQLEIVRLRRRKNMAVSDTVTDGILTDVKELLKLFGVPWVNAPGEAEAQCATLVNLGLCEGVITDDSDILLFSEKITVYKDVFKKDKNITRYSSLAIKEQLGVIRPQLIDLAQLSGSDYCAGVAGIGAVKALEIIRTFHSLSAFLSVLRSGDIAKKYLKYDFKGLPSDEARNAYLQPSINTSTEPFSWDIPDFTSIKEFLNRKLGWTPIKVAEVLKPVEDACNRKEPNSIKKYFHQLDSVSKSDTNQNSVPVKTRSKQKSLPAKVGRSSGKNKKKRAVVAGLVASKKKIKVSLSSDDSDT